MSYRVINDFVDLQDNRHMYYAGDTFPRNGHTASAERLASLAGAANLARKPLIEFIPDEAKKTPQKGAESVQRRTRKRSK